MRQVFLKYFYLLYSPVNFRALKFLIAVLLSGSVMDFALADSGTDLLEGTDQSFWATFNGTGKKYLYAGEGILALITYIKSKNVAALIGVIVISVFINILLKFAGEG